MNKKTILVAFTIGTIILVSDLLATGSKQPGKHNEEGGGLNGEAHSVPPANFERQVSVSQEKSTTMSDSQGMEGRVVDLRGQPVPDAEVIASRGHGAQLRTRTDQEGRFSLKGILAVTYQVFFKEQDGPGGPDGLFYTGGTLPPEDILANVRVFEGQITSGILIHTGPKWPKLSGRVLDAETNEPIITAHITLRRVDNPDYFLKFGPGENGNFTAAVPTVPITIEVSAAGYENWTYRKNGLGGLAEPLKISIGETKALTIKLRR